MSAKRFCGTDNQNTFSRSKRYVESGKKWYGKNITYAIENFTPKLGEKKTRFVQGSKF